MFLRYLEGFKALFDGLGWYLDDLGWFGQNLEFLRVFYCYTKMRNNIYIYIYLVALRANPATCLFFAVNLSMEHDRSLKIDAKSTQKSVKIH